MMRISIKALKEFGCVTFLEMRERERVEREIEATLDRVVETCERAARTLDECPKTLRAT